MPRRRVTAIVKIQLPAGSATPPPPVGTALGPHGINVNRIAPGFTATEASLGQDGNAASFEATIAQQCLKRREEPDDVVGTAVFLASADSDFITGQYIVVNGGSVLV